MLAEVGLPPDENDLWRRNHPLLAPRSCHFHHCLNILITRQKIFESRRHRFYFKENSSSPLNFRFPFFFGVEKNASLTYYNVPDVVVEKQHQTCFRKKLHALFFVHQTLKRDCTREREYSALASYI